MTSSDTPTTKHCPGFLPGGQPPHDLPADREHFYSNAGNADGLATRCRACGKAYGKAWSAAKKAGLPFSARPGKATGVLSARENHPEPGEPTRLRHQDGSEVFSGRADQVAEREADRPPTNGPQYADALALSVESHRKPAGYTTERVGSLIYALPTSPAAVATERGQAALALVNEARATERRRKDAERKRAERARAKAAQAIPTA